MPEYLLTTLKEKGEKEENEKKKKKKIHQTGLLGYFKVFFPIR